MSSGPSRRRRILRSWNNVLSQHPSADSQCITAASPSYSAFNMAAILSQKQDGKERFLGCVEEKCNVAESNYSRTKGELAAVVLGLRKFEHILHAKPLFCGLIANQLKICRRWKRWEVSMRDGKIWLAAFNFPSLTEREQRSKMLMLCWGPGYGQVVGD